MQHAEQILLSLGLAVVGGFNLRFAYRFRHDDAFALHYTMTSPKAALWRARYGVDGAIAITRRYFVPIGAVVGVAMVIGGLTLLVLFGLAARR